VALITLLFFDFASYREILFVFCLVLIVLGVNFGDSHGALWHQDADNSSFVGVLLNGDSVNRTGESFDTFGGGDQLDLGHETVSSEGYDSLGHAVAQSHAEDGQENFHRSRTLVHLVSLVEHALLNEGVPEGNVLVVGQAG